jgi:hypothetical protein
MPAHLDACAASTWEGPGDLGLHGTLLTQMKATNAAATEEMENLQTGATHMQSHYCVHKLHGQSALITPSPPTSS